MALDFETFFDSKDKYSLRSKTLSTSEFVRDVRFATHGVAWATHTGNQTAWEWDVEKVLARFSPATTAVLAHNAAFDGLILSHHFNFIPSYYFDTMSMARAMLDHSIGTGLDEVATHLGYGHKLEGVLDAVDGIHPDDVPGKLWQELGNYAIQDVNLMYDIFCHWFPTYPEDELDLIDLSIRTFAAPRICVDKKLVREALREAQEARNELLQHAGRVIGESDLNRVLKILGSSPQFAQALRDAGLEAVPMKKGKNGMIPAFAKNDMAFQALKAYPDEKIRTLVEARLNAKSSLPITRAQTLLKHADPAFPVMLNYCRAHTFRWSGGDKCNPQNFPARDGKKTLRKALRAPIGQAIIVADASQIEDRMNCWWSGQNDVLDIYREKGDPYKAMAARIYTKPVEEISGKERFVGKTCRLALGYQAGKDKFHYILVSGAMGPPVDIEREDADRAHETYRLVNNRIVANWAFMSDMIHIMRTGQEYYYTPIEGGEPIVRFYKEGIEMPNGLVLWYPDIEAFESETEYGASVEYNYRSSRHQRSKIYGGLLTENVIQSLSRIIVGEQMLKIADKYRVVMMTHDEVVFLAPWRQRISAFELALEAMSTPPTWAGDIPLDADGGWGKTYGDTK